MAKNVAGRSGSFQNLKQRVGTGIERAKQDAFLLFLDWDEEEECELKKLSWNGSWPDTLSNRKHEHLTCLFEAACAVSICPALNVNQNPTSEWELEFCG